MNKLFGLAEKGINSLSIAAMSANDSFRPLNSALASTNTRLASMEDRLPRATFQMADMGAEAERVAVQMEVLSRATTAAGASAGAARSQFRGFGMGGGGGHGGGGHRGFSMGHLAMRAVDAAILGVVGMDVAKEGLKPTFEFADVEAKLPSYGIAPDDAKRMTSLAQSIAVQVPTSTPTQNLTNMAHMQAIFKRPDIAMGLAPHLAKAEAVLNHIAATREGLGGHGGDMLTSLVQAAELVGRGQMSGGKTPQQAIEAMTDYIDKAIRGLSAQGGLVSAQAFGAAVKRARTGRLGKSDEFEFGIRPMLLQELGSGTGPGQEPALERGWERTFVTGKTTLATMLGLQRFGAITDPHGILKAAPGKMPHASAADIARLITDQPWHEMAVHDPHKVIWDVFGPLVRTQASKQGVLAGKTDAERKAAFEALPEEKQKTIFDRTFPSLPDATKDFVAGMFLREPMARRDIAAFNKTGTFDQLYDQAQKNLATKLEKVNSQFNTLATTIGHTEFIMRGLNLSLDLLSRSLSFITGLFGVGDKVGQMGGNAQEQLNKGNRMGALGQIVGGMADVVKTVEQYFPGQGKKLGLYPSGSQLVPPPNPSLSTAPGNPWNVRASSHAPAMNAPPVPASQSGNLSSWAHHNRPIQTGPVTINVNGAHDPVKTARAVAHELNKVAFMQAQTAAQGSPVSLAGAMQGGN